MASKKNMETPGPGRGSVSIDGLVAAAFLRADASK